MDGIDNNQVLIFVTTIKLFVHMMQSGVHHSIAMNIIQEMIMGIAFQIFGI